VTRPQPGFCSLESRALIAIRCVTHGLSECVEVMVWLAADPSTVSWGRYVCANCAPTERARLAAVVHTIILVMEREGLSATALLEAHAVLAELSVETMCDEKSVTDGQSGQTIGFLGTVA
jgi:hypothetical protein